MPFEKRITYLAFVDNQKLIEEDWDKKFGDRRNEIVFIGQDMNEAQIKSELNACIATEEELATQKWEKGYNDEWPFQRVYALDEKEI